MTFSAKRLAIAVMLSAGLGVVTFARVAPQAPAEDTISGTITATRIINQNARLTGDVSCTVTGVSCIQFGAAGITLNLNGFTLTGLADPVT